MMRSQSLLERYRRLTTWNKFACWGSLASIGGLILYLLPNGEANISVKDSPGAIVVRSGRDTIIGGSLAGLARIQSLVIEGRLTCTLKPRAAVPPPETQFVMLGDGHAYFETPRGRTRVEFSSPVRFRRLENDSIVVINRFGISNTSDLQNQPIEHLTTFTNLRVPTTTVVYGSALETMILFEVVVTINGQDVWACTYPLNVPFQHGPVFTIPLDGFRKRISSTR